MSAMPAVSVIINCLNGEKSLPRALASVAAQSFEDFEIIFYDNASDDSSAEIAKSFGPRLRYFRGDKTIPLGAARNRAIREARGRYIAFLDCDDLWLPQKLERQVALLDANPRVGLCSTDTEIRIDRHAGGRIFENSPPLRGMVFEELMKRQWISMSSAVIRREALDLLCSAPGACDWFDESLNVCEEADLFYRIAHDWEVDQAPEALTVWSVHGANTTLRKFGQFAEETRLILAKHRRIYPDYDLKHPDLVRTLERRADFQEAVDLWRRGYGKKARSLVAPHMNASLKYRLFWLASHLPGSFFGLAAKFYIALPGYLRKAGGRKGK